MRKILLLLLPTLILVSCHNEIESSSESTNEVVYSESIFSIDQSSNISSEENITSNELISQLTSTEDSYTSDYFSQDNNVPGDSLQSNWEW